MAVDRLDEEQIESDLELIGRIRDIAWQRNPKTLLALIERLQVYLLVEDISRRHRRVYRAIIDYFEDILEDRIEKDENVDRDLVRRSVNDYIRDLLKSLDD